MKNKALKIAELADEKMAEDIVVLDLRKLSNFCDYFVIATGNSGTHVRAIADGIRQALKQEGRGAHHREGYDESRWIVLDFSSIIVHVFDAETRAFYDLEHLWADAKKVKFKIGGKK